MSTTSITTNIATKDDSGLKTKLRRQFLAQLAMVTGGIAPTDYAKAWWEWFSGVAKNPKTQGSLLQSAFAGAMDNVAFAARASVGAKAPPAPDDPRFAAPAWNVFPFNVYAHTYKSWEGWWKQALAAVPGMAPKNAALVEFAGRQAFELASPAHGLLTNPELLETTRVELGQNLVHGLENYFEDLRRLVTKEGPVGSEAFKVGENVAVSPGTVVFRNRLIELIQYTPQTPDVFAEPVLITPAWIMKYYIMDLSPANSMVRYLVEKGHTVFVVSWKNPNETDRDLAMDDYVNLGFRAALDAVTTIVPDKKVHAAGYCIGGTLQSIAAAVLAGEGDTRLASLTMLAAQTDFSEPGELSLFISPRQLEMLAAVMHKEGVLSSSKMGGSFTMLRSRELLWAPIIDTYIRGKREPLGDIMAWNADGTRMPARMHTEYLYRLYLDNELGRGTYTVGGKPAKLDAITAPMFVVGTESDHVAPWRSVYKARGLTRSTDYTFLLTSGGHNAGIISGPVHPKRRYKQLAWRDAATTLSPDEWQTTAEQHPGSWWPAWEEWLVAHSSTARVAPPRVGNPDKGLAPLGKAPGEYVRMK